jgi:hypothetical protein
VTGRGDGVHGDNGNVPKHIPTLLLEEKEGLVRAAPMVIYGTKMPSSRLEGKSVKPDYL